MKLKGFCCSTLIGCAWVLSAQTAIDGREPQAPPPAEPPIVAEASVRSFGGETTAATALYSIGDPTPEEQLYVEFINRARLDPEAEGIIFSQSLDPEVLGAIDFFNVDVNLMLEQFAAIAPAPPVAFNAKLNDAARQHSQDMFDNAFQGHTSSNGDTLVTRIRASGYNYSTVGENVYSYAESVFHGHAGFEVDWGIGEGGMQTPPGHRITIHNPNMREVGVGVVLGTNTSGNNTVGPQVVTQNFGSQQAAQPLITGVAYYDVNKNNFYDIGEGIGGVNVAVNGEVRATTARSGGYAVPVNGNGSYTVTFAGAGFSPVDTDATVVSSQNVKVDFKPIYFAPVVAGPPNPGTNVNNTYTVTPVAGATAYEVRQFQKLIPRVEGAENGTAAVIATATPYNIVSTTVKKSGTASFQFAHPVVDGEVVKPVITLSPKYLTRANSTLNFHSRLGRATADQIATVQVSADYGNTWETIYTQSGTGSEGETVFTSKSLSLTEYTGKEIQVRFSFQTSPGQISLFTQTSDGFGWYVDDIQIMNGDEIVNDSVQAISGTSFTFNPTAIGNYSFQARARAGHLFLPWGPVLSVRSAEAALALQVESITKMPEDAIHIDFVVISGTPAIGYSLQGRSSFSAAWRNESVAAQPLSDNRFRFVIPNNSPSRFFRVKGD